MKHSEKLHMKAYKVANLLRSKSAMQQNIWRNFSVTRYTNHLILIAVTSVNCRFYKLVKSLRYCQGKSISEEIKENNCK